MATKKKRERIAIYVYCTPEEKKRIEAAAKMTRRSKANYMLAATLAQVERDEKLFGIRH